MFILVLRNPASLIFAKVPPMGWSTRPWWTPNLCIRCQELHQEKLGCIPWKDLILSHSRPKFQVRRPKQQPSFPCTARQLDTICDTPGFWTPETKSRYPRFGLDIYHWYIRGQSETVLLDPKVPARVKRTGHETLPWNTWTGICKSPRVLRRARGTRSHTNWALRWLGHHISSDRSGTS